MDFDKVGKVGYNFVEAPIRGKAPSREIKEDLLDHEELSNRMLRKAEAVIQWRTSRLIIVIERCTNGTCPALPFKFKFTKTRQKQTANLNVIRSYFPCLFL